MNCEERVLGSNAQYIRYPLPIFFREMKRLGIRKLDFVPKVPHFFCSGRECSSAEILLNSLQQYNLEISVLTPPPYRYSICAAEETQRRQTEDYYCNCIGIAACLHCRKLVLDASGACWDVPAEQLLRNAKEMLKILCRKAREYNIQILLAAVMGAETPLIAEAPVLNTAAQIRTMLRQVDEANLGACLDTNIMSACGDTIGDWFDQLGHETQLVRLCDGNHHGWRAWGDGILPMETYLRQLLHKGYRGDFSLYLNGEYYTDHPGQAAEQALSCLRREG